MGAALDQRLSRRRRSRWGGGERLGPIRDLIRHNAQEKWPAAKRTLMNFPLHLIFLKFRRCSLRIACFFGLSFPSSRRYTAGNFVLFIYFIGFIYFILFYLFYLFYLLLFISACALLFTLII